MWIMINNNPFDLSKLNNVSGVIELTTGYLFKDRDLMDKKRTALIDKVRTELGDEEYQKLVTRYRAGFDNEIIKYAFLVGFVNTYQKYLNKSYNGIGTNVSYTSSSLYNTKEAAQTALEHFLLEVNGILSDLPKINI